MASRREGTGISFSSSTNSYAQRAIDLSEFEGLNVKQRRWLQTYSVTGQIRQTSRVTGIDTRSHYYWMNNSDGYAEAFALARQTAADYWEGEAVRRAVDGVQRIKLHRGEPILVEARDENGDIIRDDGGKPVMVPYVETAYSDALLSMLLRFHRPERYGQGASAASGTRQRPAEKAVENSLPHDLPSSQAKALRFLDETGLLELIMNDPDEATKQLGLDDCGS